MNIKKISYNEKDNTTKLVKCLVKDKSILENIPHQPGEFSAVPFKLTTTCNPNKKGDYYDYYTGTKQLATTKHNIKTPFSSIKIIKYDNIKLKRIKTKLSIHQQYKLLKSNNDNKNEVGLCLMLKGGLLWGEFIQDNLPYLYFCKDLLYNNDKIKIICKNPLKFDSYDFIIKKILKLKNKTIFMKINQEINFKKLYIIEANGPFASGLFPYQGHCTCPVILYKNLYNYININIVNNNNNNILIYTKRNTGNKRRNVSNENIIINLLKEYCIKNNLHFVPFFYKKYTFEERINLFNRAKIIVGIHGSANFHTLFCNKNVKIIEFICIKDCHSTQLVNLSYGLEYWQIPIKEHGQFEKVIKISNDSLDSMSKILSCIK